ncbi:MAG: glycerophosphodiester phosphodiesterase [Halolamina sp.]
MTRTIAHRGFAGVAPENTVGAAVAAAGQADLVEVDVRPSADGDPVVFHDDRLGDGGDGRGLTDAAGLVRETSTADLRSTRVLGTDEHVPTLDELLAALPADTGVNVELKSPGADDLRPAEALAPPVRDRRRAVWRPFVETVASVLAPHDHEVLLSSFFEGALAAARTVTPATPVAVIVGAAPEAGLTVADRYDAEAVHPSTKVALADDAALVAAAHEAGRAVNAWTADTWHEAARLVDAGVDGVIANYPGLDWDRG